MSVPPNRSCAIFGPRRTFASCRRRSSSADVISVLTSTTRSTRRPGCQASTSIEPRSPNSEYVTSVRTSHRAVAAVRRSVPRVGVALVVEQAIELAAAPPDERDHVRVDGREDPSQVRR